MKLFLIALWVPVLLSAQDAPANPLVSVSKSIYATAKNNILRSVDKVPEDLWSFQPTPEIRTFGQLFAHVADGQYEFCGVVAEGKSVAKDIEQTAKTRAEVISALKAAFAYCDGAYAKMTDANAPELVSFFNTKITKLGAMDLNTTHTMEHYGNLVTYMRLKGIVPPTSEPRPPTASKKE